MRCEVYLLSSCYWMFFQHDVMYLSLPTFLLPLALPLRLKALLCSTSTCMTSFASPPSCRRHRCTPSGA